MGLLLICSAVSKVLFAAQWLYVVQQYKIAIWSTDQNFGAYMVVYSPRIFIRSNYKFDWAFGGSQNNCYNDYYMHC